MIPFSTTDAQKVQLYKTAGEMAKHGLSNAFITLAVQDAEEYEGTFELMVLWQDSALDADGSSEREQIIAELQEVIDEHSELPRGVEEKPYIKFDELKIVADKVVAFKAALRKKVDRLGGISKLANQTGIPQPSLSRFFATAAMPRRTTLYKIAKALNLSEADIATDWIR